ncbi:MAG: hypothetical protein QXH27_01680 [Candidatus Micrarchaeia archaeon]
MDETLVRINKQWMYLIIVWCPTNKLRIPHSGSRGELSSPCSSS